MTELMEALSISTNVIGSMSPTRIEKIMVDAAESAVVQDLVDVIVYAQSRRLIDDLTACVPELKDALTSAKERSDTASKKLDDAEKHMGEADVELRALMKRRQAWLYLARKAIENKVTLDPEREVTHGQITAARGILEQAKIAVDQAQMHFQVATNRLQRSRSAMSGLNRAIKHFEELTEPKALTIRSVMKLLNGKGH